MMAFILVLALFILLTRRWSFWGWLGTRSLGQLMGASFCATVVVWSLVQVAGYGA